jgi:hypothetical protein
MPGPNSAGPLPPRGREPNHPASAGFRCPECKVAAHLYDATHQSRDAGYCGTSRTKVRRMAFIDGASLRRIAVGTGYRFYMTPFAIDVGGVVCFNRRIEPK